MGVNGVEQDNLFYDVGQLIIENNNASVEFVQSIFNIDKNRINDIMKQLENEGVVSADIGNGRVPMMSLDEYKMIFAHHFNRQTNKTSVPPVNNVNPSVNNYQAQNTKSEKGCCLLFLLPVLFMLLVIFLFCYATIGDFSYLVNEKLSSIVNVVKQSVLPNDDVNTESGDSTSGKTEGTQGSNSEEVKKNKVTGWVQEGLAFKYFDSNGNQVRNAWIDSGGNLYFFDEAGYLATSRWIEYLGNDYYVDADGKMLSNQWINDTYYVGVDGVKLKNTMTPDGYYVGADGKYVKNNPISMLPNTSANTNVVEPVAQTFQGSSDISEPISNFPGANRETKTYKIQSTYSHSATVYLENDKTCSIRIQLPIFEDSSGNIATELNALTEIEKDNIITELEEMANNSIEELERSTKYMRSINLTEGRISTQDDYSITYRMSGKANWNNGKSEKTIILVIYDKDNNTLSYYLD